MVVDPSPADYSTENLNAQMALVPPTNAQFRSFFQLAYVRERADFETVGLIVHAGDPDLETRAQKPVLSRVIQPIHEHRPLAAGARPEAHGRG